MTPQPPGNLLKVTRILIIVLMVLLGVAAAALVVASIAVPFKWADIVVEIARERPNARTDGLMPALLAIMTLGLLVIGITWTILQKLLAIIGTVAEGNPFVQANALRLKAIGWMMAGSYLVGIPLFFAASEVAERFGKHDLDGDGLNLSGVLAILLVFVLAGVFEQGAAMREEMEGTV